MVGGNRTTKAGIEGEARGGVLGQIRKRVKMTRERRQGSLQGGTGFLKNLGRSNPSKGTQGKGGKKGLFIYCIGKEEGWEWLRDKKVKRREEVKRFRNVSNPGNPKNRGERRVS